MSKMSMDDLLYTAGEKMELQHLEQPCACHSFSKEYEERKAEMIRQLRNSYEEDTAAGGKRRSGMFKGWKAAALALACVGVLSASAYAYFGNGGLFVSQDENRVHIQVGETGENGAADSGAQNGGIEALPDEGIDVPLVNISLGYVPQGYALMDGMTGRYSQNGAFGGKGFWVLQETRRDLMNYYVQYYEQTSVGNMEAVIVTPETTDTESTYRSVIYLLNPQDMVLIEVGTDTRDISQDELVKIAENVSYESTGETVTAYSVLDTSENRTALARQTFDLSQISDSFTYEGAQIQVTDVTFLDNISGLDMDNFYEPDEVAAYISDDGTLIDERVVQISDENGPVSAQRESADQKLMLVTLNIQNNSENDIEDFYLNSFHVDQFQNVNGQLSWPAATGTDILDRLGYGEWCYMENGQHTQGEDRIHSFFVIDIPAGSGRTVTLGISVFAQDLEDSYIYFAPSGAGLDGSASDSVQFYDLKPWL